MDQRPGQLLPPELSVPRTEWLSLWYSQLRLEQWNEWSWKGWSSGVVMEGRVSLLWSLSGVTFCGDALWAQRPTHADMEVFEYT